MKHFLKYIIVGFLIITTCSFTLIYGFLLNKNLSGNVLRFEWPLILTERFLVQHGFRYLDHSFIVGRDSIEVLIEINGSKIQFPPSSVELWSFEYHPTFFQIVFEVDSSYDKILLSNLKDPVSSIRHSPNDGFEKIEQYFHTKDKKYVVVRTQLLTKKKNIYYSFYQIDLYKEPVWDDTVEVIYPKSNIKEIIQHSFECIYPFMFWEEPQIRIAESEFEFPQK